MLYYWIRIVHVDTVIFNIAFFLLRFHWMIRHPELGKRRWVRIVSVLNDTLLLAAGGTLAYLSHQYPLQAPWLSAKLTGLILYIVLGSLALKRAPTLRMRLACGVLALLSVAYILTTALGKTPYPWLILVD